MSKGTPHIYVSDEQFKEVETVAKRLGVTTSTVANLILQSIVSITEQTLGANRIEYLKNQPPPSAIKVLKPAKLPLSVHTKREVGRLAKVIQLSEEAIAMWSIHGLLSEVANIKPPNRHILPSAIQNKVLEIERNPHGKT